MDEHGRLLGPAPIATLDDWVRADGGLALAHAAELAPTEVVDLVDRAGLRGRGGAGFPTATKWRGVRDNAAETGSSTALVCNAAEGEPGTFKDRVLLADNPFAVLEGMLVGMRAVGAEQGFLGIKERFTEVVSRVVAARDEMVAAGWEGADRLVVVPGPDDYLFGEETGMLEVIEGKPALPRVMPPYQAGLFATVASPNPTVVNNVETFAHVRAILANGPDWFRQTGTATSPGNMLFTVTGDVPAPGVHELPLGTPLRTLLVDVAGADPDHLLVVYGGTSNSLVPTHALDTPMDFDAMQQAGTGLGSGGFVVYDDSRCIVTILTTLARFLADESCGQCNACKLGTTDVADRLAEIDAGRGGAADLDAVVARIPGMTDLARCYLPTGAQLTVGSTLEAHWDAVVAHLGVPCPDGRPVPVPLIDAIDDDTGEVRWHD